MAGEQQQRPPQPAASYGESSMDQPMEEPKAPTQGETAKKILGNLSPEEQTDLFLEVLQTRLSTDAKKDVVTEATQTLPTDAQKDIATAALHSLSPAERQDVATALVPDKPVVNRVWLTGVYSFAAVFVASAIGVLVTPFFGISGEETGPMLQVLMLSGGFLSGLIAGRALVGDVLSRVGR